MADKRKLSVAGIQAAAKAPDQVAPPAEPKLEKRERQIEVEWFDPDLSDWRKVTVTSRIMDGDERIGAGRAVTLMTGAIPWETLAEHTRVQVTALCQVSIQIRDMPEWLRAAILVDMDLLMLLHRQCMQHDMVYLHPDGEARKNHPSRPRLRVTAINAAEIAEE